ncbi:uncharacterized protein LOC112020339 isoform X2 [Quercus suber]|uniref:uncharacterized protein LOC112020339 isoform X2 n=1 Tax=Quercus suber TaxID=58331 RepID=UPI0032DF9D02
MRLQAFSYWSRRSPQFVVPNSQRGVFASSGYVGYWRRVQKSFADYAGSGTIGRVPNPGISSAPTSNRRLSPPTAGVVFMAVSSKTGFAEWHASREGWVTYAQDFPENWLGCDLVVGASAGVPIKKGAVEAISASTPVGMSKGKSVKQEKLKEAAAEESVEDVGPKSKKKKKTGKSQKQLILAEEKEVEQPLATRGRVKTKSKCKLDPRKGKSQSSGEDVVWLSLSVSFTASSHSFHKCYISVLPCCSRPF